MTVRVEAVARRSGWWRVAATVVTIALLAWASGAAAADSHERVRRRGVLRWGGDVQGGEPYVFQDPADATRLVGFEVELAAALAARLGVRAEFVQTDWSALVPALERGDFDVIMNGLEATPSRRTRLELSAPYYVFAETLVVRAGERDVHDLSDLRGRRVGTLAHSFAHELLRRSPDIEAVLYEGVEEPYIDLAEGRLDAVLLDNVIAARYGLVRPELRAAATVGTGVYVIGLRPDETALANAIDAALDELRRDGTLKTILSRWDLWDDRQATVAAVPSAGAARTTRWTSAQTVLFVRAAGVTVVVSLLAMAVAVTGGLALSTARRYGGGLTRSVAATYVEVFRGTPLLLQLYVLYYGLAPLMALNAMVAAVLGLGMNYAAYEAEIYRAGLAAVPAGQSEAALALGMSRWTAFWRVVFPQALRTALPGMANDFIAMLKDSSLVSVITVVELTKQMTITAVDVHSWLGPGILCAGLYLAMSYPLSRGARRLERYLAPAAR
ncbi:ABC transporter substrate-binding protein/permease [Candidatus Binatia bacterium]|nr:ABC transporter substrate-binding protein/permease [Candidatus Binatia bacterium]